MKAPAISDGILSSLIIPRLMFSNSYHRFWQPSQLLVIAITPGQTVASAGAGVCLSAAHSAQGLEGHTCYQPVTLSGESTWDCPELRSILFQEYSIGIDLT